MELDTLVIKPAHISLTKSKNKTKKWRKSFTKNQIAIDTTNQTILTHKIVKGPRHGPKDAIALIKKTKKFIET